MKADLLLKVAEESLRFELVCAGMGDAPRGLSVGWRTLPCADIVYIKGDGFDLEFADSTRVHLSDVGCCIPAGIHYCSTASADCDSMWMHANYRIFSNLDVLSLLQLPPTFGRKVSARIEEMLESLTILSQSPHTELALGETLRKQTLGFALLEVMLQESKVHDDALARLAASKRLLPAIAYMQNNLSREVRIDEIARLTHLSPSRFNAVFKSTMKANPRSFLQRLRMQRAQELLIGTDLNMSAIAEEIGLESVFHFSRIFKKCCGYSPSEYRQVATRRTTK